jgi:hypothetical protein
MHLTEQPSPTTMHRALSSAIPRYALQRISTQRIHRPIGQSLACTFHSSPGQQVAIGNISTMRPLQRVSGFVGKVRSRSAASLERLVYGSQGRPQERASYTDKMLSWGLLIFFLGGFHYTAHLEYNPIVGRWRFMNISQEDEEREAKYFLGHQLKSLESLILPNDDPRVQLIQSIIRRITNASVSSNAKGEPICKVECKTIVIEVLESQDAYMVWNGNLLVPTGLLLACEDDESMLAFALSHEVCTSFQD